MQKQRQNLRTIYISERIQEKMRYIRSYALTTVVAPMGYGKTTAIDWYLTEQQKEHQAIVLRLSVYSDNLGIFWRKFQNTFAGTDFYADIQKLSFPNDRNSMDFFLELLQEYLSDHPQEHILFIDDFHLLPDKQAPEFLAAIARHLLPNFHLIVASRDTFLSRKAVVELGMRLHQIGISDLQLNATELSIYCHRCGVPLPEEQITQMLHISEGWFSGIYLCLRYYLQYGIIPEETGNIYDMIDEALLSPLPEERRRFMIAMCVADDFTEDMAAFITQREDAAELLRTSVENNAFISILSDQITYRFHHMLKECTRRRLRNLAAEDQHALLERYGIWYEQKGLYSKAMLLYQSCGNHVALLRVIGKDRAVELSNFPHDTVVSWIKTCSREDLKKNPFALLVIMRRYFSWRMIAEMYEMRELFLEAVAEDESLSDAERNNLLGECDLVMSFIHYNDIEGMSKLHRSSCEKMNRLARTMDVTGSWTFGSPSVLAMFHRVSGELDKELVVMHESMPYYYRLTDGHGMGAEHIMEAEAMFLQGSMEKAHIALEKAKLSAEKKKQGFILLCCLMLELRMSFQGIGTIDPDWYQRESHALRLSRDPLLLSVLDICAAYYFALLGLPDHIPEWLRDGHLDQVNLLFPARPVVEIISNQVHLAKQEYAQVIAREDSVRALCQAYPYPLCTLHLEIQLAVACRAMNQREKAGEHILAAISLGKADGLLMPFVENASGLDGLLPSRFADELAPYTAAFAENRMQQYGMFSMPLAFAELTDQERQIAALIGAGKRNKEIADTLFLSEGTVKQYINRIYSKLQLTGTTNEKRSNLIAMLKN